MQKYPKLPTSPLEFITTIKQLSQLSPIFTQKKSVHVRSYVVYLHSTVSVYILLSALILVTMKDYFGEQIECLTKQSDIPQNMLQHYCWMEGIFSVIQPVDAVLDSQSAYFGMKTYLPLRGEKVKYHKYYQWVYFMLIIQCVLFYIPKMLNQNSWSRFRELNTNGHHDKIRVLKCTINAMLNGKRYFCSLFGVEIVCFFHVIFEFWLTNIFLGNSFLFFGFEWIKYTHSEEDNYLDPLMKVFPRITKCTFHKYGYSGTIEKQDTLCFLPLNIVNEKIYLILWFWFTFLLFFICLAILIRTTTTISQYCRCWILHWMTPNSDNLSVQRMSKELGYWYVLHVIAEHIEPLDFAELFEDLTLAFIDPEGSIHKGKKLNTAITELLNSQTETEYETNYINEQIRNDDSTTPQADVIYESNILTTAPGESDEW